MRPFNLLEKATRLTSSRTLPSLEKNYKLEDVGLAIQKTGWSWLVDSSGLELT